MLRVIHKIFALPVVPTLAWVPVVEEAALGCACRPTALGGSKGDREPARNALAAGKVWKFRVR